MYIVAKLGKKNKYGLFEWEWIASFHNYGIAYNSLKSRLEKERWVIFKWREDPFRTKCDYLFPEPRIPIGYERIYGKS